MAAVNEPVEIWRYTLHAGGALNRRSGRRRVEGFLVRAGGGHGCVQPWPEFGHAPVDDQLAALAAGRPTRLVARALACARVDAAARHAGRSLFADLTADRLPRSHATITDVEAQAEAAWDAGFRVWKLKMGPADGPLVAALAARWPALRFRLDFNAGATADQVAAMVAGWPGGLRDRIDFLEDPCPGDRRAWVGLRQSTGMRLAADAEIGRLDPGSAQVVVCKPAWLDPEALRRDWPDSVLVITSAMDHPLGQAFAAWLAAADPQTICGVQTHHLFEPDAFSERLGPWRPVLHPPGGTGLGFDDLLDSLPWKRPE